MKKLKQTLINFLLKAIQKIIIVCKYEDYYPNLYKKNINLVYLYIQEIMRQKASNILINFGLFKKKSKYIIAALKIYIVYNKYQSIKMMGNLDTKLTLENNCI